MEAGRVGSGCGVAAVEGAGWTFQRRGVCAEVASAIGSRVPMRPPRQVSRCRLFLSFIGLAPCVCCDCRPIITHDARIALTSRALMITVLILHAIVIVFALWAVGIYTGLVNERHAHQNADRKTVL